MSELIEGFEDGWLPIVSYKWLFVEKSDKCLTVCFSAKAARVSKSHKAHLICSSLVTFVRYATTHRRMICEL